MFRRLSDGPDLKLSVVVFALPLQEVDLLQQLPLMKLELPHRTRPWEQYVVVSTARPGCC